jgi:hypothetical protein
MRGQLRSVPHAVSRGQEYKMNILWWNHACFIFEISQMISKRCGVLVYMKIRARVCVCVGIYVKTNWTFMRIFFEENSHCEQTY